MIQIQNLHKSFGTKPIISRGTFNFPKGERVALVGANGAGKTTLLNMICGLDIPDEGAILTPSAVRVGYLPQKPNPEPEATVLAEAKAGARELTLMAEALKSALKDLENQPHDEKALEIYADLESSLKLGGWYSLEARTHGILKGLGFQEDDLSKSPRDLSGGWRMRLELARLFLSTPDFLILDEPTNHLDLPSLVWVEHWLMSYRGTLLFVSHDKALLNRLATMTLHLHQGRLTVYRGNFDSFLVQREAQLEAEEATATQLRRRREAMEHFVERFGAKATKASQAQSRLKMIARIRDLEENLETSSETPFDQVVIRIPPPQKTPRIVYEIKNGSIGYSRTLSKGLSLTVEKGQKIAVIGANGIGKTTLLKTMAEKVSPLDGHFMRTPGVAVAYFAQDQTSAVDPQMTVLEQLLAKTPLTEPEARSLLGSFMFRGDDVFKKTRVLSGGELSRLGLATALAQKAGILLMDEPTNHLDMTTVETLASALDEFEGTLLFVSHDRNFIDAVCTHVLAMLPDGRSRLFPGKLADYERMAAQLEFPNVLHAVTSEELGDESPRATSIPSGGALTHQQSKERKAQRQKLARRLEQIEKNMASLSQNIQAQEALLPTLPANDYGVMKEAHQKIQNMKEELQYQESEWIEVSEQIEVI